MSGASRRSPHTARRPIPRDADGTARGVDDERLARVNVSAEVLTDVQ